MSSEPTKPAGPDLERDGIAIADIPDGGMLVGHALGEAVLLVRRGEGALAIGATCTHYSGPLADGIVEGDHVRCPWHHACFDLRTGEASSAPALSPVACFETVRRGERLFVLGKKQAKEIVAEDGGTVVVLGGGAAGMAAIEMLRRRGHAGRIVLITADDATPYDRPNLSKDYLAGTAPEEWLPLRGPEYYKEQHIDVHLRGRATAIDVGSRRVRLDDGRDIAYDALLLATGADPIGLTIPGADLPHVRTLRTLSDSRAIIARATNAKCAVVMGASFIGLEVAASLRTRGLEVHVVAPEARPLVRVLGPEIGGLIQRIHEAHGVVFHLGTKATVIDAQAVTLENGSRLATDLVVAGIGVRPCTTLAEHAGLKIERGITVDATLRTSAPSVWAAGDVARYPDARWASFGSVRVEHWVVAERQGQAAARNILAALRGREPETFVAVPFFWSNHYDAALAYVGHAESWDVIDVDGNLDAHDFAAAFRRAGRTLAVATMGRDRTSLDAEIALEQGDEATLQQLVPAG